MKTLTLKRKDIVNLVNDLQDIHEKVDKIFQTEKGLQLGIKVAEQMNELNNIQQNLKRFWLDVDIDNLHKKVKQ